MSTKSYIYAASSYIPHEVVKSEDLMDEIKSETNLGISRTIINEKMGIFERRFAPYGENCLSKLATKAAQRLIKESKIDVRNIGCVIYCGIEGDYTEPSTAHIIQSNLGINGFCFDISNACHGFCDAIIIANSLIKSEFDNILIVTAEIPSYVTKLAIESIKKDSSYFKKLYGMLTVGDASGAMLISTSPGILGLEITHIDVHSKSDNYKLCYYHFPNGEFKGQMIMDKICAQTLLAHKKMLKNSMQHPQWKTPDFLIPHQVGERTHLEISKTFNFSPEKLSKTYPYLGNITSATMPVNIYNSIQKCNTDYENYLMLGSGSGISLSQISLKRERSYIN